MSNDPHTCKQISELIDAYHDGELAAAEQATVQTHLDSCIECQKLLERTQILVSNLKSIPSLQPSFDIIDKIDFDKLASTIDDVPAQDNVVSFKKRLWAGVGIAAAAAIVLAIYTPKDPTRNTTMIANQSGQSQTTVEQPTEPQIPDKTPAPDTAIKQVAVASLPQDNPSVGQQPEPAKNNHLLKQNHVQKSSKLLEPQPEASPARDFNITPAIASLSESGESSCIEALGIATDEDGLYDIKI